MKKISLIVLLFCSAFLNAQEQAAGIQFEHTPWKAILAKAEKEKKIIMLDAYASWCGPCKWMAKNIFTTAEVGDFFNSNFVNAKIDMEKGEGVELAKKYGVQAYPTFLFINSKGEIVHRVCGGMEAPEFIGQGKAAMDDQSNYASLKKRFKENPKENALAFFEAADGACDNVSAELDTYLKTLSKDEVVTPSNFKLVYNVLSSYDDPSFAFFHSNYAAYESKFGSDTLDKKLQPLYEKALTRAGAKGDQKKMSEIQKSYAVIKDKKVKKYLGDVVSFASIDKNKDPQNYYLRQADFVENHLMENAQALNQYAWSFYEEVSDTKLLERASKWAEKAISLNNSYAVNDTYASLLFKLGRKAEAKKAAETAITLAKKTGEDAKETEELLKKIDMLK